MKTVGLQITDAVDGIKPSQWPYFREDLVRVVSVCCYTITYSSFAISSGPGNHCIVAECDDLGWLQSHLQQLCNRWPSVTVCIIAANPCYVSNEKNPS
jgi:hypothetical protein